MKQAVLISIVLFVFCGAAFSQKLTEPVLLGDYLAGEDPSEFLLHWVMEASEEYLKTNPEGKLIVRICSADNFSTAFVKAPLNPLKASFYNVLTKRIIVPYEKIFIANSSKCLKKNGYGFNQYWFVPDKSKLEYLEMFSVNEISYKKFSGSDYDFESGEKGKEKGEAELFEDNIARFVNELKSSENAEGFITYLSMNKRIKRNIAKVLELLKKENIELKRVKSLRLTYLIYGEKEKLVLFRIKKETFPALQVITIKK